MNDLTQLLINPYVFIYLLIVFGGQIFYARWRQWKRTQVLKQRRSQGLPDNILLNHTERLVDLRTEALTESTLFLLTVIIVPFILVGVSRLIEILQLTGESETAQNGLVIVFITLLLWILLNGTDVAKAFLGGLAFKTLAAFYIPFQVGDQVTLKGISGKVTRFNTFFITLQTPNDDQICLPTHTLWSEILTSANAGERSSLCVMSFYLASFVTAQQRQAAEDVIWNAIQSSVYFEPSKPMQIYLSQTPEAIQLTAKAYVGSTYNEPLFTSDVTRAFLDFTARENIALAPGAWELGVSMSEQEGGQEGRD